MACTCILTVFVNMESHSRDCVSPNIFTYTSEDVSRIMNGGLGDIAFLSVPSKVDIKRLFESDSRRYISLNLHLSLLGEYFKHKIIPRGLRSHLKPNLFPKNMKFCTGLEGLSNKCALDVILLNIDFLQQEIIKVQERVKDSEIQLSTLMEANELS